MTEWLKSLHESNAGNFQCISSWWPHRNEPNVLLLFYEDLKHDLEGKIKEISQFIQIPLTEDELHRITYLSSFEYMSNNKEKFKGNLGIKMIANRLGIEPWSPKVGLVRVDGGQIGQGQKLGLKLKGIVDEFWKEYITDKFGFLTYEDMFRVCSKIFKS